MKNKGFQRAVSGRKKYVESFGCFHIDGSSASHRDVVLFVVCVRSLWGPFSLVRELLKMLLVETSE